MPEGSAGIGGGGGGGGGCGGGGSVGGVYNEVELYRFEQWLSCSSLAPASS